MFCGLVLLALILIWIIFKRTFAIKTADQKQQRFLYNSHMALQLQLINGFGYVIKFIFNIYLFLSPNFDQLKQQAIKINKKDTGILLEDFGDENEMKLTREIFYYQAELHKFDLGASTVTCLLRRDWFIHALKERLRIVNNLKCHPEIQNIPISAPICITGLPRTGSTLLFNLLSLDSSCRFPKAWECLNPSLPCNEPDSRIKETDELLNNLKKLMPTFISSHYFDTHLPEECFLLFRNMGLDILSMEGGGEDLSLFLQYLLETVDGTKLYKYHKLLLQLLSYKIFPDNGHWLIKFSLHLLFLKSFLEIYPDARIIIIHRDPLQVVPSLACLMAKSSFSDYVDLLDIGKRSLHLCGVLTDIMLENETNKAFLHIQYNDLFKNPIDTIKKIYSSYNLNYSMEFEGKIKEWLENNPQYKHGRHVYSLDNYYLSKTEIQLRFRTYCNQFNVMQDS